MWLNYFLTNKSGADSKINHKMLQAHTLLEKEMNPPNTTLQVILNKTITKQSNYKQGKQNSNANKHCCVNHNPCIANGLLQ